MMIHDAQNWIKFSSGMQLIHIGGKVENLLMLLGTFIRIFTLTMQFMGTPHL